MRNNFIQEILNFFQEFGEIIPRLGETPYSHGARLRRSFSYSSFYRLEKKGLIKKKKRGKYISYYLSEEGKRLCRKIDLKQKREDGYSTLIIFDIPEEKRNQRNILRRYLLKNGFTLLQESVFISPDKLASRLKDLITELKISNYITVLDAKVSRV